MRRGGRLFILLGVGLALVAALLAVISFTGGGGSSDSKKQETMVTVVQAARDVSAKSVLREEDLQSAQVAASTIPPGAITSPSQAVGLAVNGDLIKGQQILMANLAAPGLTNMVSDGKRAVALPIDRVSALGGMIQSDDYIDIIYTARVDLTRILPTNIAELREDGTYKFKDDSLQVPPPNQKPPANYPYPGEDGSRFIVDDTEQGNPVTKLLLQNIRVLRVIAGDIAVVPTPSSAPATAEATKTTDKKATASGEKLPGSDLLVLEVDPQQAELIKFIEDNQGSSVDQSKYQVILRAADDHSQAETKGVTYDKLMSDFGLPAPKSVRLPGGGQ